LSFNIFTQPLKEMRFSKTVAGYHMLMILSDVDGESSDKELKVIRKYMSENFSDDIDYDIETEKVRNIKPVDYPVHFNDAMNSFYLESTKDDRNHFLDFAVKLVIADHKVSPKENLFLNELFTAWEADQ
jgi:hypothetical protein